MQTQFISDLHLSADRPDITARFSEFCQNLREEVSTLYILGDLFEYWIGDDGAQALGVQPVLDELARLTDRGRKVHVMHGNRDFLIGTGFTHDTGCTLIADPVVIDLYGHRVLLAHGDAYCTDDVDHQKWRALYLNPEWQSTQLALPIEERVALANELRKRSNQSKQDKSMAIMDVTESAIRQAFDTHSVDIMIHGHTHRPGLHRYSSRSPVTAPGASNPGLSRLVLGDWFTQSSYITATNTELHLQPGDHSLDFPLTR